MSILSRLNKIKEKAKEQEKKVENVYSSGDFNVAGVTFENRQTTLQEVLQDNCKTGSCREIILKHDHVNEYDENAIEVFVKLPEVDENLSIGFVPRTINKDLLPILDDLEYCVKSIGRVNGNGNIGISVKYKVK